MHTSSRHVARQRSCTLAVRAAAALLVFVGVLTGRAAGEGSAPARPNVLFIVVDDLNDWVGCLGGHPDARTPNIDRLAARGVLFTRAYVASPACNPSRTAVLTGVRPWASGVYLNPQPWRPALPDAVTLPQHFRSQGYATHGMGKIFHGGYNDSAAWTDFLARGLDPVPAPSVSGNPRTRSGKIIWGALDVGDEAMDDHRVVDRALDVLGSEQDEPFFLACGIYRPHLPWQVPRAYYAAHPLDETDLPEVLEDDLDDVPQLGRRMASRPANDHARMLASGNWRRAVRAYLASVAFADAQVGRVLDALDAGPHRDDTIIVFWSDHGWHLGEKQHWRKFALWEEATRVPLVVVAPGVTEPGGVCARTVDLMALYPTLAELCGLGLPAAVEGPSLLPLLRDPEAAWERPAISTYPRGCHAVRSERYRYIRYADGGEELYDHDADPLEWKNLAGDPRHAKELARLAAWLPESDAPSAARDD